MGISIESDHFGPIVILNLELCLPYRCNSLSAVAILMKKKHTHRSYISDYYAIYLNS